MTHPSLWRCPTPACPVVFGAKEGGDLRPLIAPERIDAAGRLHFRCPLCSAERKWTPGLKRTERASV